ncbi:MAG: peptidyl-prolyl cis-trans isomerase [Sulfurimonas sp.]
MYRKSLLFFFILFSATLTEAKIFDAIALIVEGEAVTTTEIKAVRSQLDVSKQEAIDILIQDRLQKIAMKDTNIAEDAVDKRVALIAERNSISVSKMQKILKEQGTSWNQYRTSIKNAMKKEKFFNEKVAKEIPAPTEDQLKLFYNSNKNKFTMPSSIKVIEYSASTKQAMENFLKTKKGLKGKYLTKKTESLSPALLEMMLRTPDGKFTQYLNAGDRYIAYKIRSKEGKTNLDFESAKTAVAGYWKQEQRTKALKDYFNKMRTSADIQIIRE